MNAVFFTRRQFEKLKKCVLQKEIIHTESQLYVIEKHERWNHHKMLLKYFYNREGEYFGNKLFTINHLISHADSIDVAVLPTELAVIDGEIVGYIMPFIENTNLLTLLRDYKVTTEKKKEYLKQVGKIIDKIHHISELEGELFLGDIHEANFIVGKEDDNVYAVDTDSFKVKNNIPFASKYLATNPNIIEMTYKYPVNEEGIHIPNKNSDLLCYVFTILNTIARESMHKVSIEDYYEYLEYLETLGFGAGFLQVCQRIYSSASNVSPLQYLDQIPDNIYQATYKVFQCRTGRTRK